MRRAYYYLIYNNNKQNMVIFYKKLKKYNEIQTKNKMDLNNQKMKNHPPSPDNFQYFDTNLQIAMQLWVLVKIQDSNILIENTGWHHSTEVRNPWAAQLYLLIALYRTYFCNYSYSTELLIILSDKWYCQDRPMKCGHSVFLQTTPGSPSRIK